MIARIGVKGGRDVEEAVRPEEIIAKLREADVLLSQGAKVADVAKAIEIHEVTYYRWRKEYGGMTTSEAKRMKEMEKENARLKRLVAELSLDISILRDVNAKNF